METHIIRLAAFLISAFFLSPALANPSLPIKCNNLIVEVGGVVTTQGKSQNINIADLIGDRFTLARHNNTNLLVGLGYFIRGYDSNYFTLLYGVNAFYLGNSTVKGTVIQEQLFTNLSYRYTLQNYPVYAALKFITNNANPNYNFTLDLGVGPNFIRAHHFSESSIDDGMTIPDDAFSGRTTTAFSATAGIGMRLNKIFPRVPLEISYRFFYLGEGSLKRNSDQILNKLKTGNSYANALILSAYF